MIVMYYALQVKSYSKIRAKRNQLNRLAPISYSFTAFLPPLCYRLSMRAVFAASSKETS